MKPLRISGTSFFLVTLFLRLSMNFFKIISENNGIRTTPVALTYLPHPSRPARLLTILSDGSIKLLSPATGAVLVTCFPVYKDVAVKDAVGDMYYGMVYGFLSSGGIGVWDVNGSPGIL